METQTIQITLKGSTFNEVIVQAQELVEAAQKFKYKPPTGRRTRTTTETETDDTTLLATDTETDDTLLETETDTDTEVGFDDVEETETPPARTAKGKKITDKEINAAAMAHAKKHGRPKTLALLAKKFKVKSILELKPDQYETVLKALTV